MHTQVNIPFEALVKNIQTLTVSQLRRLKAEIDKKSKTEKSGAGLEALLLNGPVATKEQLKIIKNNRNSIRKWRGK